MSIILLWTYVALQSRTIEQTWWSPGAFLALTMWLSAIGTINLAPEYYMSLYANIYLAILTMLTSFAAALGQRSAVEKDISGTFVLESPNYLFWFGMAVSLISLLLTFQAIGVDFKDLLSPLGIMRAAQRATFERYTEGIDFPIYYNIANALFLSYAMILAVVIANGRDFRWRMVLPLLIYVSSNMLITTRAPILFMLLLMAFSGIYALRLKDGLFPSLFTSKMLLSAFLGMAFVAMIFFIFQVLRFGENSGRTVEEVWDHLRRWPWGSLPGFSLWFDGFGGSIAARPSGSFTFMGLYDVLGISQRQVGGFEDYIAINDSEAVNIYTSFRGLWHDFGGLGSAIFMILVGFSGGSMTRVPFFDRSVAMALYVGVMSFVAFAWVVSYWAFTANLVALFIFPFLSRRMFVNSAKVST